MDRNPKDGPLDLESHQESDELNPKGKKEETSAVATK